MLDTSNSSGKSHQIDSWYVKIRSHFEKHPVWIVDFPIVFTKSTTRLFSTVCTSFVVSTSSLSNPGIFGSPPSSKWWVTIPPSFQLRVLTRPVITSRNGEGVDTLPNHHRHDISWNAEFSSHGPGDTSKVTQLYPRILGGHFINHLNLWVRVRKNHPKKGQKEVPGKNYLPVVDVASTSSSSSPLSRKTFLGMEGLETSH